jgi:hypothetical protein
MSVTSVCNTFKKSIEDNYSLNIFADTGDQNFKTWATDVLLLNNMAITEENMMKVVGGKTGASILKNLISAITKANEAIDKGLLYLFNDLEHSNGEHQNFLVINSLSEIFRNSPSYSFETDSYTEKLEYAYTCGQLYSSYSKASDGTFLSNNFGYVMTDVKKICQTYESYFTGVDPSEIDQSGVIQTSQQSNWASMQITNKDYLDYINDKVLIIDSSSSDDEEDLPLLVRFWIYYYKQFQEEIQPFIDVFNSMVTDWEWFYDEITSYKEAGTDAAKLQAVGYTFTSSDNRSELASPTMTDVFSSCETKFQTYDSQVEYFYSLWKKTLSKMEEKTDLDSWDANSEKYKMFTGAILEDTGFFTKAKNIYNEFLTFFQKYGIQ